MRNDLPKFRTDLEILEDLAPTRERYFLITNPDNGELFRMTPQEYFLCQGLDGKTSLADLSKNFAQHYNQQIKNKQLKAFVQNLRERGLLTESSTPSDDHNHSKVLPINANHFFNQLHNLLRWTFSYPAKVIFYILAITGTGILAINSKDIFFNLANIFDLIVEFGLQNGPEWHIYLQLSLVLIILPIFRELYKGVTCRHLRISVPEVRIKWWMGFIPLLSTGIGLIMLPRHHSKRMRVATAGLKLDVILLSISLLTWMLMPYYQAEKDFFYATSLAAFISFFLNAIPLGKRDGALTLAVWADTPNLRDRAVAISRAWLTFRTMPEPLPDDKLRLFLWYGLLADFYQFTLTLSFIALSGYLLVSWLDGVGAAIFLILLLLNSYAYIWSILMSLISFIKKAKDIRPMDLIASAKNATRKQQITFGVIALLFIIVIFPYTKEISGEFHIRPIDQREIRSEIDSQVESVNVKEGEWVKQGQVIIQLTKRFIEKDLDAAKASLEHEQAVLKELEDGPKPETIAKAEQEVKLSEIELTHARRTLRRADKLQANNNISAIEYDRTQEQVELARGKLELSRRNLALEKSGATDSEIDAQKAEVKRLKETIKHLENDITLTTITSPISGQIISLSLASLKGQSVEVGSVVAKVADTSEINLRITVPEKHIDLVKIGNPVQARMWALPDLDIEGKVSHISPVAVDLIEDMRQQAEIEQDTGAVRSLNAQKENVVPVLVRIPNTDGRLKVNMSGYAKIEVGTTSMLSAFSDPISRFFKVMVWSWLP